MDNEEKNLFQVNNEGTENQNNSLTDENKVNELNDSVSEDVNKEKESDDIININYNNHQENNNDIINIKTNNANNVDSEKPKKTGQSKIVGIISAVVMVVVSAFVSYFFVFRKENGTLICTMHQDLFDTEFTIQVKDKRYESGKVKYTYDFNEIAKTYGTTVDELNFSELDACANIASNNNIYFSFKNCRQEHDNSKLYVYVDLVYKLSNNSVGKVDEFKKSLEKEGFTCKNK